MNSTKYWLVLDITHNKPVFVRFITTFDHTESILNWYNQKIASLDYQFKLIWGINAWFWTKLSFFRYLFTLKTIFKCLVKISVVVFTKKKHRHKNWYAVF